MGMEWSYDRLWIMLIKRKLKRIDLVRGAGIHSHALTRMGKEETVTMDILEKLCKYLNCRIEDIVEYVPDEDVAPSEPQKTHIH